MTILKDVRVWFDAMGTLPWYIRLWATFYPLPQLVGGLAFITTVPGLVIFAGRVISGVIQSQIHKRAPFSKLMGPVGHAHWLLIGPYLVFAVMRQEHSTPLNWFMLYVIGTTGISAVLDIVELTRFLQRGHVAYRR